MKKTCDGCKAYVHNARYEYCSKGYKTYLQETRDNFTFLDGSVCGMEE